MYGWSQSETVSARESKADLCQSEEKRTDAVDLVEGYLALENNPIPSLAADHEIEFDQERIQRLMIERKKPSRNDGIGSYQFLLQSDEESADTPARMKIPPPKSQGSMNKLRNHYGIDTGSHTELDRLHRFMLEDDLDGTRL